MSWRDRLRDRLGRFAAARGAEIPTEPELSPAVRQAVEWLADDPARLGPLAEKLRSVEETSPLAEVLARVDALTDRADKLVNRDRVLDALAAEGYTAEGISEIVRYAATHRLTDLREAARRLEREVGYSEPVVSSRVNRFALELRRDDAALRSMNSMKGFLDGTVSEEDFLEEAVAGALRECRGG